MESDRELNICRPRGVELKAPSALEVKGASVCKTRQKGMSAHKGPFRNNDLMIATISGLLAWIITLCFTHRFCGLNREPCRPPRKAKAQPVKIDDAAST
jgi:hypothetical protein